MDGLDIDEKVRLNYTGGKGEDSSDKESKDNGDREGSRYLGALNDMQVVWRFTNMRIKQKGISERFVWSMCRIF